MAQNPYEGYQNQYGILGNSFKQMNALNRQRGIMGNPQFGNMADMYAGYFGQALESRDRNRELDLKKQQLAIQQQEVANRGELYQAQASNANRAREMQWVREGGKFLGALTQAGIDAYKVYNQPVQNPYAAMNVANGQTINGMENPVNIVINDYTLQDLGILQDLGFSGDWTASNGGGYGAPGYSEYVPSGSGWDSGFAPGWEPF